MIHSPAISRQSGCPLPLARLFAIALLYPAADARALDLNELNAHRAAWNSHNVSDYNYIMQWQCRCSTNAPALVSVRSNTIVSVVNANTFEPLPNESFLTIDESFDRLQEALPQLNRIVNAEFDPLLDYPRFVSIDNPMLADEEVIYRADNLAAVPEPTGVVLALGLGLAAWIKIGTPRRSNPND
jgi:uncharacterized protein DUF6174